jgi:hypothetical protein
MYIYKSKEINVEDFPIQPVITHHIYLLCFHDMYLIQSGVVRFVDHASLYNLVNRTNLVHNFFLNMSITFLYMFRATMCLLDQKKLPYLCDTWYMSLYIDNCLVCKSDFRLAYQTAAVTEIFVHMDTHYTTDGIVPLQWQEFHIYSLDLYQ